MNKPAVVADPVVFWGQIHASLAQVISSEAVTRWFTGVTPQSFQGSTLVLGVDNEIFKYWIEDNYLPQLNSVATRLWGKKVSAKIVLTPNSSGLHKTPPLVKDPTRTEAFSSGQNESESKNGEGSCHDSKSVCTEVERDHPVGLTSEELSASLGLHHRYTFDTFVVGPNNALAAAAAKAVSDAPARTYNPLFLHGRVGLGKTHLMHAIGFALARKRKGYKVQYVTSEQFTNDFITAIQHGELIKFRKRYRQVDALLIDDVQFLAGKDRSQEEFFHTFNSLFDGSKQIILTCDSPPSEIANIEKRLSSRFEWGLTAEIMPPEVETRVAILRNKLATMQVQLQDEVLMLIATRVKTNVRRLEGALTRVAAYAALHGKNVTVAQVELLLKDLLQNESPNALTIDHIQRKVAETFDIRLADMTSKRRPANIALPRMVAMYLSRRLTSCSLNEIGDAFGGRDHGTVLHAARSIDDKIKMDAKLNQTVQTLLDKLNQNA